MLKMLKGRNESSSERFKVDLNAINNLYSNVESMTEGRKDRNKRDSKLSHEEWLVFTRSVWGFKDTESNAKTGLHPSQFSAVLPMRLIKLYSVVNELVLDPFVGTGTTLEEAMKLKRFSIGLDVNPAFLDISEKRIKGQFRELEAKEPDAKYTPIIVLGDARDLWFLRDNSIHLIVTHPPYWNAVKTSNLENDLGNFRNTEYDLFLQEMRKAFIEMCRVLRRDRVCAIVTGDVMRRVNGVTQLYALHSDYIQIAKEIGLRLWDTFIWETKIRMSGGKPMMGSYPYPHKLFSQFAHNYILIFRKN